ncbi:universal stress protein [Puniceibacterium sediminis]|uniref:Nucleotide-binding universal stress protein, UspA family n=1 Tax=Puniceibacterium sediminis TaxID=1608407 RepID=A0A238XXM3_9RHOB|nr:universal stress protein [Puniceibacterium sediminis]SNR63440.1 Nucleotide-binding universal stress protein, UspA family [Puniceibacterium sediminis]
MSYKTILTVLTEQKLGDLTLEHGYALAEAQGAHLDVLCIGVDRTPIGYFGNGSNPLMLQETLAQATEQSEQLATHARGWLHDASIAWAVETGTVSLPDVARSVAGRARFADLVVLPKPYGKDHGVELVPVIEGALFEGLTPVMVVPDDTTPMVAPQRVVLAWNGSAECLRAVRAAIPVLAAAKVVHVVLVDPPGGVSAVTPGGSLARYLARHGVEVEIDVLARSGRRVSDILVAHVREVGAEMIVMGAYGHSRFREAILGGATRNMLEQAEVPVLMAH